MMRRIILIIFLLMVSGFIMPVLYLGLISWAIVITVWIKEYLEWRKKMKGGKEA